jgi:aminoglycoside phosphotransferase (APT) family kinase protein
MTDDLAVALAGVLSEHVGHLVTVSALRRLAGGSSHETWAFDAAWTSDAVWTRDSVCIRDDISNAQGGACIGDDISCARALVLRREFRSGMLDTDVAREFHLLRTLFDAGVPVPRPWLHAEADSALGTPFLVMERAAGTDLRKDLARDGADRDLPLLAARTVELLAAIHEVPPTDLGLDDAWGPRHEIERWAAVLDATKTDLDPVLAAGLGWLHRNQPPAVAPVLVHGDFKANNLLIGPGGELTVLDWELAHPGDPAEDLAWTMLWRTGWDVVGGLHTPGSFVAAYTNLTGRQMDPSVLRFWRIFSLLKLWAMFLQGMTTDAVRPQLRLLGRATVWIADRMATELLEAR